jgi:hypothetical protein
MRLLVSQLILGIVLNPCTLSTQQSANDFAPFWEKLKDAVTQGDKKTVARLSRFPLGMSYGIRPIKSRAELFRRYREVFSQQTDAVKCFAEKKPEQDETNARAWSIACPDEAGNEVVIFHFQRTRLGWRFVGMDNINE